MSRKLIELFQRSIGNKFHLDREDRNWLLHENNCKIKLKSPDKYSLGFSLDRNSKPSPFPFFTSNPPCDIAKMCDAIIALSYKGKAYIFVIEQKTGNKGEYYKQLTNGKYFCDWLLALLNQHKHYSDTPIFIGLLCWEPRDKSPRKGPTTHGSNGSTIKKEQHTLLSEPTLFKALYEIQNQEEIYLQELIGGNG